MAIHWILLVTIAVYYGQIHLFKRWALTKIDYERQFDRTECYAGDEVELIERISNRKPLPVPWLRLEAIMSSNFHFMGQVEMGIDKGKLLQNHTSLFSLMPYTEITRRHQVHCLKRGYYFFNSATMTSGDILGLTKDHQQLYIKCRITVYPRPISIEEIPLPSSKWLGDLIVRRWIVEDPFFIHGVREYQAGDPMNSIHWKATARSGKLQVNQRAFTADHKLMILLNIDDSPNMWDAVTNPEKIEQGIVYAASIAEYVTKQGIPTGFASNGRVIGGRLRTPVHIPCQIGLSHLRTLMDSLAKLELWRSIPFEELLRQVVDSAETSTDCLILTCHMNEKIEREIKRIRSLGHTIDIMWLQDQNPIVSEDHHANTAS
jgi:Protein of unknown function DUF58